MASRIPQIPLFTKRMCIFILVYYGIHSFVRFMTGDDYPLMFNTYYYFVVSYSPVYEMIYLSQIMAAAVYILTFANSIGLYGSIMAITCSQLEKLRANLLDIRQELDSGAETDTEEWREVQTSQEVFCRMQEQLNECIRHHQQIIRFMRVVEEIFNPFLVGLFLLLMCGICLTAFSVAMNWGDLYSLSEALLIYCFLMLMLCVYCRFGEELTNQAESVRHAAWGCDWVGTPVQFQRCLLFIIATANKEFRLTAGKFVTVSNKTLINIFNQTISFFMFLIQVKDKTEDNQNT
ncbi:hypothetical protein B7P43_G09268 [Cryptotermes secundus]|uniref:Odorant receptor n=2 Tax=Cryptotermes secundus TaxID=105785 RepID=A0A2J7R2S0_9NEOP|nr:odorant receptor 2a isoform X2 [Cryptotermes secundus]PNF35135.1 hypothetical protein B7P43_G09268 [Cryptotermes secundus]